MTRREIEELKKLLKEESLLALRDWGYAKILKKGLKDGGHKIERLDISKHKWYPHYWCSECGYTYCLNDHELYHKKQHKSLEEAEKNVDTTRDEQCDRLEKFPSCQEMIIKGII